MPGVYSVLQTPRPRVYTGLLADLLLDGKIYAVSDFIVPSDAPRTLYRGDGVNTFSGLSPMGAVSAPAKAVAINTTALATSATVLAGIKAGLITSTSVAAVSMVLPIATILAPAFNGVKGTKVEFTVDNAGGASAVTLGASTGVTVITAVLTGSDSLVVAAGAVAIFRLYFVNATTVKVSRVQ